MKEYLCIARIIFFIHFHSGSFITCTRALSLASRTGHASAGTSTVRHGGGQPDGVEFTVLVPLALWSQALQQVLRPHADQQAFRPVNNHRFLLLP